MTAKVVEPSKFAEDATRADDGKQLAAGGAVLGAAMVVANGGNYLLNVLHGRWLTPAEFADANLIVTLMLLVSSLAVGLQLVAARFTGIQHVSGDGLATNSTVMWLHRWAVGVGLAISAGLIGGAGIWRDFFNSASAWPFVILGAGIPLYLVQAVGRGVLQGRLSFRPLAATFVVEMIVRVAVGIGLVAAGFGVEGATFGVTASFAAVWLHVRRLSVAAPRAALDPAVLSTIRGYAGPVGLLLLGQIIINNGDVLIAKRFLEPDTAGVYAAIALVGRAVFFLSWSVATTLFPAAAQRNERGENSDSLLYAGMGVVAIIGVVIVVGSALLGGAVLAQVFGPEYSEVSGPLAWYAFATSMFAMANLVVSHYLSMGRLREVLVLLVGGAAQTALLLEARGSIESLVGAQAIAMVILLVAVLLSHVVRIRASRRGPASASREVSQ